MAHSVTGHGTKELARGKPDFVIGLVAQQGPTTPDRYAGGVFVDLGKMAGRFPVTSLNTHIAERVKVIGEAAGPTLLSWLHPGHRPQ